MGQSDEVGTHIAGRYDLWTNDTDYIWAESEAEARAVCIQQFELDPEDLDGEDWYIPGDAETYTMWADRIEDFGPLPAGKAPTMARGRWEVTATVAQWRTVAKPGVFGSAEDV